MAVYVSFIDVDGIGSVHAPGIGAVRKMDALAIGGTSTEAEGNEIAIVYNGESAAIFVSRGAAPDATTTTATAESDAAIVVGAGQVSNPIVMRAGDKIDTAATS